MKINPTYRAIISTSNETYTIEYPLTMEFSITRNTFGSANTANFRFYNLNTTNRDIINRAWYDIENFKFIDVYAGYNNQYSLIFKGSIRQAYSYRTNQNIITEINAFDADIVQSYTSLTFDAGTTFKDGLLRMASNMSDISIGAMGTLEGSFQIPTTFEGNTLDCINKLTGNHSFIDNGILNTIQENEAVGTEIMVLNASTGLLGTPIIKSNTLDIDILFEPKLNVGNVVEIQSTINKSFDGQYKIAGIRHTGIISGAVAGTRRTTLNLLIGHLLPNSNFAFTRVENRQNFSGVKGTDVVDINTGIGSSPQHTYNYVQKHNKAPNTYVTSGITWKSVLNFKNGNPPLSASRSVYSNLFAVSMQLQNFVNKYFPGRQIIITSGFRSRSYNASISNASKTSKHIDGLALDYILQGVNTRNVGETAKKYWNGYTYYDTSRNFIHVELSSIKGIKYDW